MTRGPIVSRGLAKSERKNWKRKFQLTFILYTMPKLDPRLEKKLSKMRQQTSTHTLSNITFTQFPSALPVEANGCIFCTMHKNLQIYYALEK